MIRVLLAPVVATSLALGLGLSGGCVERDVSLDFDDATVRLSLSEPALLDEVNTFVVSMFFHPAGGNRCGDLLAMSPAELSDLRDAQGDTSSSQPVSARGEDGSAGSHAFGRIGAPGAYSYLVLGARADFSTVQNSSEPLGAVEGSTIAIGCRELDVRIGKRHDLQVVLVPAGLR